MDGGEGQTSNREKAAMSAARAGRTAGVLCGALVCLAAVFLVIDGGASSRREERTERSTGLAGEIVVRGGTSEQIGFLRGATGHGYVMIPTILGGLLAIAGGLLGRPGLLILAFFIGFGLYLLGPYLLLLPPGVHSIIGYGELGYLVAAALLFRSRNQSTTGELAG